MYGPLQGTAERSTRRLLTDPKLKKSAFLHKEYTNYIQLIPRLMQAESYNLCAKGAFDGR